MPSKDFYVTYITLPEHALAAAARQKSSHCGLHPAISIASARCLQNRDGRDKPGHDEFNPAD
jgi:hypothetical protein